MDIAIIIIYLRAMLLFGWWGKSRTKTADFLVAGRRLGPRSTRAPWPPSCSAAPPPSAA